MSDATALVQNHVKLEDCRWMGVTATDFERDVPIVLLASIGPDQNTPFNVSSPVRGFQVPLLRPSPLSGETEREK